MKKISAEPKLLRAKISLASKTKIADALAFTRKIRGILKHLCHETRVEFIRGSLSVVIRGIGTSDDLQVVKATAWGVAEGMNLELRETDFGLDW